MTGRYRLSIMLPLLLAASCAQPRDGAPPARAGATACAPGSTATGCAAPAPFNPLDTGAAQMSY